MYKLTAAHRTLPFETMVRVTNVATANPPLFASRTADLLWTIALSIFLLPPPAK